MNLYHVSQEVNNGYDTYSDFVCAAETEDEARNIHPSSFVTHYRDDKWYGTYSGEKGEYETDNDSFGSWVRRSDIDKVQVVLIGVAKEGTKKGVICASFHAG